MGERKERVDKKKRFPIRMKKDSYNRVRVLAFNCNISMNRVMVMLIEAALETDMIIDTLYAAYPPGENQFIYIEEGD